MSPTASPFLEALSLLVRARVGFVIVGVGGINFYARDPAGVVVTQDLDLFLDPRVENLRAALVALRNGGFSFFVGEEPFLDLEDRVVLGGAVRNRATLTARGADGVQLDLMLSTAGFGFEELAADAESFRIGEIEVAVGRLEKLLRSKELSGRPRDIEFLRLYAARLRETR